MSFNSRSPERPGNTRSHPFRLRSWRARSRTATACGLSGTRCSFPAFIRSRGSIQVRASTSISDQHVRASPLRAAVRTRNRRQRRTAARDRESSTLANRSRTSACGRARWLLARRRRFGGAPSIASPATFRSTNSRACAQPSTVRICWRTRLAVVGVCCAAAVPAGPGRPLPLADPFAKGCPRQEVHRPLEWVADGRQSSPGLAGSLISIACPIAPTSTDTASCSLSVNPPGP